MFDLWVLNQNFINEKLSKFSKSVIQFFFIIIVTFLLPVKLEVIMKDVYESLKSEVSTRNTNPSIRSKMSSGFGSIQNHCKIRAIVF